MIDVPVHEFKPDTKPLTEPLPRIDGDSLSMLREAAAMPMLPKVFMALCTRDWQTEAQTSESVRAIGRQAKCEILVRYMMNDGVARARNNLAAMFLESDCTHICFIDNDIIAESYHLDRLLSHKKRIVGALYPKKQAILDWVINMLPGEERDENGLLKVKHIGTGGLLLIEREMIEETIRKRPEIEYRHDPSPDAVRWDLFPMHAEAGLYKSEDWFFCERARQDGFEIFVDTTIQLRHIGKIVYPLQFTLGDEECVDIMAHRYGIPQDKVRAFIGSGNKMPGLMGGHREKRVRLWPSTFQGIGDLHQGDVLAGCYDVPIKEDPSEAPPVIIDIGADCGAFAIWAARRWRGSTIHSYEWRLMLFGYLQTTAERLRAKHREDKNVFNLNANSVRGQAAERDTVGVAELPKAEIIKIDFNGGEREIVCALHEAGRISEFDAILVRYYSEVDAFFIRTVLDATHYVRCHQPCLNNQGIIKFLHRKFLEASTPSLPKPSEK